MGNIVDALRALQAARRSGWDEDELVEAARALNGEVWRPGQNIILCPSPGRPADDRSCEVRFNPGWRIYVYSCDGDEAAAYAMVYAALGLEPTPKHDFSADVERIWRETLPGAGSLAETYLRSRSIILPVPDCLRFHPALWHKEAHGRWPGMVAERMNAAGCRVALHRTFLAPGGHGKAGVDPAKKDLAGPGGTAGTAIRLAPVACELVVGEGIETTLSFMQAAGLPGWAAGSAKALTLMELPPEVRSVVIAADGDDSGRRAANAAGRRWEREGRKVTIYPAPAGRDFNDLLIEEAAKCRS